MKKSIPANLLIQWIKPPSLLNNSWQERRLKDFLQLCQGKIINIGTHERNLGPDVFYADLQFSSHLDIVFDIHFLPFKTEAVGGIIMTALLEHVKAPEQAVIECFRVLNEGGKIYASVPFLFPYHADPGDYQRFTHQGLKHLFRSFHISFLGKTRGIGSMLAVILREFFSIMLSFNNQVIYNFFRNLFSWILFPLKYLDYLTVTNRLESIIASGFTIIAEKSLVSK